MTFEHTPLASRRGHWIRVAGVTDGREASYKTA